MGESCEHRFLLRELLRTSAGKGKNTAAGVKRSAGGVDEAGDGYLMPCTARSDGRFSG